MKKIKFIHPITGEAHEVTCEKVESYEMRDEVYHHCTINKNSVGLIPMSYAMYLVEENV